VGLGLRQIARSWHEQIGDPTLADGILDRLVHDAETRGDCMRKNRGKTGGQTGWLEIESADS
jgi:hypothetical protein